MSTVVALIFVIGIVGALLGKGLIRTIRGTIATIVVVAVMVFVFLQLLVIATMIMVAAVIIRWILRYLFH